MAATFQIAGGRVAGINKKVPGWYLTDGEGSRSWVKHVNFPKAFAAPPIVVTAFSLLDLLTEDDKDYRISVEAQNVTATGFDLKVGTWNDSKVWAVAVSWFAYEKDPAQKQGSMVEIGRSAFHMSDAGYTLHENEGPRDAKAHVKFSVTFHNTPVVLTAFGMLDLLCEADVRAACSAESVNTQGFDVSLKTWSDSKVWSAAVVWVAIDGALFKSNPRQLQAGSTEFNQTHPAFGLHHGEGSRSLPIHVQFTKPFLTKPDVVAFLSKIDVLTKDDEVDIRLNTDAANETPQGFELSLSTWRDSQVWSGKVSWIAWGDSLPPGTLYGAAALAATTPARFGGASNDSDDEEDSDSEEHTPAAAPAPKPKVPAAAPANTNAPPTTDATESAAKKQKVSEPNADEDDDDATECKICMDAKISTVIIPCGHICVCVDCSKILKKSTVKQCPICKQKFTDIIKTFTA